MNRFMAAMKMDVVLQWRTQLYSIGMGAGVLVAVALAWLARPDQLFLLVPTLMLLVVGASTMLYVAAMILFEKEQGTLKATIVSPVRPSEYLWAKIITLTGLATVEAVIMVGGAMGMMGFSQQLVVPNILLLLLGIVGIGLLYTLVGIVMIVRYDKITEVLIPLAAVAGILQLPFLYFLGWVEHPLFLLIPTSAPTMVMRAAYVPLSGWQWVYGVGYTAVLLIGLIIWAHRAFEKHIVAQGG